jgi:hypothetical protein
LHGTVYHEVLKAADKLGVDVIVLSAHRPAFKDYFLGSNAARIVRHAKQSVYVVRNQLTCQTTFLGVLPAGHYPPLSKVTVVI